MLKRECSFFGLQPAEGDVFVDRDNTRRQTNNFLAEQLKMTNPGDCDLLEVEMKFKTAALALVLASGLLTPSQGHTQSYPIIDVKVDRAKVMRVSRPAAMIIIGNPSIADATIKDSQTLIITGKQYGTTNLIVLDAEGEPIADEVLSVTSATENSVVVYKGVARQTLNCAPDCEPVFRMGDDVLVTDALKAQIQTYSEMTKGERIETEAGE